MLQNSGNILVISSDASDVNRIRNAFMDDYNVFTASTVAEGHKILKYYDIHVMLIQQKMDEMTGLQFCESINHAFGEVIKIILAESTEAPSLQRAIQTDLIYRYIEQPFDSNDLKMTVHGALKLSESEFQNRELNKELAKYKTEREDILKLFKRYVPGEVVSQALQSDDDQLMRPGESRIVSVLFADIRGFTDFTSQLPPSEVVNFLNDYWELISECVKANKGSVNKYMGDGMLAIFGAPVSYIDNHVNAVSAALDMLESLEAINAMYREILGTEIKIGVGINTGEVIVGNVGAENYMEYSVIGDTVNIAARLEELSKNRPNSILISERTCRLVRDEFEVSDARHATINGKEKELTYYQVFGKKPGNIINLSSSQSR